MKRWIDRQREYFAQGHTLEVSYRLVQLQKLKEGLQVFEDELLQALYSDFRKPPFEGYATEIGLLKQEVEWFIKRLKKWSRRKRVRSIGLNFPSADYLYTQPRGVVLIISPWNYPVLLSLQPLIAAIAAGNCVILKPSENSMHTSAVLARLVSSCFEEAHVKVVQGGVEETKALLQCRFDLIFFTGSTAVGKIVQQAASRFVTPTILELGGKCPCIVTAKADIRMAAKRVMYGKFVNAGQTCVAPDFVWIEKSKKQEFVNWAKHYICLFYGQDAKVSEDYPRIINEHHFQRLTSYLKEGELLFGGDVDAGQRYIEPTLLHQVDWNSSLMKDEIFGPLLPVMGFENLNEVISYNSTNEKPLALYLFSEDRKEQKYILKHTQSGGICLNDVLVHLINPRLPFGGVGASGHGRYHGKFGFEAFSHQRSTVFRGAFPDIALRYPPYRDKIRWLRRFM